MKIEVRYQSKSGNTMKIAEAIAWGAGVSAKSIEESIPNEVDVLFLGGAKTANSNPSFSSPYGTEDAELQRQAKVGYYTCITHLDFQTGRLLKNAISSVHKWIRMNKVS